MRGGDEEESATTVVNCQHAASATSNAVEGGRHSNLQRQGKPPLYSNFCFDLMEERIIGA